MSCVDIDAAVGAELAVLQAEHVALKREQRWLEDGGGRDDLSAYRAHGLKLQTHRQRLIEFSARLRRE